MAMKHLRFRTLGRLLDNDGEFSSSLFAAWNMRHNEMSLAGCTRAMSVLLFQ